MEVSAQAIATLVEQKMGRESRCEIDFGKGEGQTTMKLGRPKLKPGTAKSGQIGLRLTRAHFKKLKLCSKRDGFRTNEFSEWVRFVLMDYARVRMDKPFGEFKICKDAPPAPSDAVGFRSERIRFVACKCRL